LRVGPSAKSVFKVNANNHVAARLGDLCIFTKPNRSISKTPNDSLFLDVGLVEVACNWGGCGERGGGSVIG